MSRPNLSRLATRGVAPAPASPSGENGTDVSPTAGERPSYLTLTLMLNNIIDDFEESVKALATLIASRTTEGARCPLLTRSNGYVEILKMQKTIQELSKIRNMLGEYKDESWRSTGPGVV